LNVLDCGSDVESKEEEDSSPVPQPHTAVQHIVQIYNLVFDDDSSSEDYYQADSPLTTGHLDNLLEIESSSEDEHSEASTEQIKAPAQGKKITVADLMRSAEACDHRTLRISCSNSNHL
jgi:hypothetical protein